MNSLRAGVVGAGYLGTFHAEKFARCAGVTLHAVADVVPERAWRTAARHGARACASHLQLARQVDVASVAVPTPQHYGVVHDLMLAGVHVLVEKPFTNTLDEGRRLAVLAESRGLVLQVGHIERFNPASRAMTERIGTPMFIEANRISPFRSRCSDTDVILDLMIHDIDLLHIMVGLPLRRIHANGAAVLSPHIDIASARIEFENGCVANLTASRVSRKTERSMRVFQTDVCLCADFHAQTLSVCRKGGQGCVRVPVLATECADIAPADALEAEIRAFVHSVRAGSPPPVDAWAGLRALETAFEIRRQVELTPLPGQLSGRLAAGQE